MPTTRSAHTTRWPSICSPSRVDICMAIDHVCVCVCVCVCDHICVCVCVCACVVCLVALGVIVIGRVVWTCLSFCHCHWPRPPHSLCLHCPSSYWRHWWLWKYMKYMNLSLSFFLPFFLSFFLS